MDETDERGGDDDGNESDERREGVERVDHGVGRRRAVLRRCGDDEREVDADDETEPREREERVVEARHPLVPPVAPGDE